jgi:hypothetical protein
VLMPDPQGSTTPPDVNTIFDREGMPVGLTFAGWHESVRFEDGVLEIEHA